MEKTELVKKLKDFLDAKEFTGNNYCKKLDEFSKYSLWNLRGNTTWGKCKGGEFDCDNTEIARIIYALVFGIEYNKIGQGQEYDYRGDTLNTFAYLMSKDLESKLLHDDTNFTLPLRIGKIEIKDKNLVKEIINFSKTYLTIGNMTVLPNKAKDGKTLNTFRANAYADNFYIFLRELEKCFLGKSICPSLNELFKKNRNLLPNESTLGGENFNKFCEKYFLNSYITGEADFNGFRWWWHAKEWNKEKYIAEIINYIIFASKVIDERTKIIIDALKEKIKQEDCK